MSLPIHLHARGVRPTTAEEQAVTILRSRLEGFASNLKRLSVRAEQVVTAARGAEIVCRVTVTLARAFDLPSFVVEGRATNVRQAVDVVADAIEGEVRRAIELAGTPKRRRAHHGEAEAMSASAPTLSRRERSSMRVSVRPDREGAVAMESASPGKEVSANPPRGEHFHMTRHQAQATSARELSATRPSRKSTRKSANRSKRDSNLARRTKRGVRSPEARAAARAG